MANILKTQNIPTGKLGEKIIKNYLLKKDYKLLKTHWQKRSGEIDIIVTDPKTEEIVFCEVKTRKSTDFGYPEEAVDHKKLKKIYKTAQLYLFSIKAPASQTWRIDVIALLLQENKAHITHFKNITLPTSI